MTWSKLSHFLHNICSVFFFEQSCALSEWEDFGLLSFSFFFFFTENSEKQKICPGNRSPAVFNIKSRLDDTQQYLDPVTQTLQRGFPCLNAAE